MKRDQLTLSPEDFKLKQLAKDVDQYRMAVDLAKDSTAAWQLSLLQSAAEGGGYASLDEMTKARTAFFERVAVLEKGDVDLRKATAQQKYDILQASLRAERESLRGLIETIRARVAARQQGAFQELNIMRIAAEAAGAVDASVMAQFDTHMASIDKALSALDTYSPEKLFGSIGGRGKGGRSGASAIKQAESALEGMRSKVQALQAQLDQNKGQGFLVQLNKELDGFERRLAKATPAVKAEFDKLKADALSIGS